MIELGLFVMTLIAVLAAAAYDHLVLVGFLVVAFYVYILWRVYGKA